MSKEGRRGQDFLLCEWHREELHVWQGGYGDEDCVEGGAGGVVMWGKGRGSKSGMKIGEGRKVGKGSVLWDKGRGLWEEVFMAGGAMIIYDRIIRVRVG